MIETLRRVVTLGGFQPVRARNATLDRRFAPKTAREEFFEIVDEIVFEDRLPFDRAMAKVKDQRPDVFAAAFPRSRRTCAARPERELLAA